MNQKLWALLLLGSLAAYGAGPQDTPQAISTHARPGPATPARTNPRPSPSPRPLSPKQGGLMVDTARRFYSLAELKGFVDVVRRSGGQFLHLHLSDDQNYTLESEILGQTRAGALNEPAGYRNRRQGNRFYSREQIAELVRYANAAGVELVPEIDLPGHAGFIHRLLRAQDPAKARRIFSNDGYAQVDEDGGREALAFTRELYEEVAAQFRGNSKHFHMGGDEFPGDIANNQAYVNYANGVAETLQRRGLTPRLWNDAVLTAQLGKLNKNIEITYWDWDGDRQDPAERAANLKYRASVGELVRQGYRVLNYNHYYLYHIVGPNSADAAATDTRRIQEPQWHIGRWDETSTHNAVAPKLMYGAAVAIWNEEKPYPLPAADLQRFIEPQLRALLQKVRAAEKPTPARRH